MADKENYLARLQTVIMQLHNCGAIWRESVPIPEKNKTAYLRSIQVHVSVRDKLCRMSTMPYSMPDLMQLIVSERGEALHLYPGQAPVLEVRRALHRLEGPKLKPDEVDQLFHAVTVADDLSEFAFAGMVSFYFHFGDVAVFHIMAFRGDGHVTLEIRRFR